MTADPPPGDSPEIRVASKQGELLKGDLSPKVVPGWVTLTNERVMFVKESNLLPNVAQALAGPVIGAFAIEEQRKETRVEGPLVSLPLSEVRGASRGEFRLSHDVIVLALADGRSVGFSHSFKDLDEPLRRLLAENLGRTIVQDGPDSWHIA